MAENKKAFILYADIIHTIEKLPDDKAGILLKHILRYVNDQNPVIDDIMVELVFEPIKQQLKRDLRKWEDFRIKQSENGRLGGRPKKDKPLEDNPNNPSLISESQKSLTVTVSDTVSVTDTETVLNTITMPYSKFLEIIEQNEDDHIWMERLMKKFKFDTPYDANLYVNKSFRKYIQENSIDKGVELNFKDVNHVRNAAEKWYGELTESKRVSAKKRFVQ